MHEFPHFYPVSAVASCNSAVDLSTPGAPPLQSAGPVEFDGPGDLWSPETLLVAAVADCFILSFRAVAGAARLDWTDLRVNATGKLDRVDRVTKFVHFELEASLRVPAGVDAARAGRLLEKAEKYCLITNSLTATRDLRAQVAVDV